MLTPIHQVLVGAAPGDAITEMARRLRAGLQTVGPSEIFAYGIDAGTDPAIRPLSELPVSDGTSPLVYHSSYGRPEITELLIKRRQPVVLVHHNVTPTRYFIDHDPRFAAGLEWARVELEHLRDRVVLAVAVSEYNRADLEALGYRDVRVIAAGIDPYRLTTQPSDAAFARELDERCPTGFVLGVSQLLPHKRQDVLIGAAHLLQHVHELDLGLVLVGTSRMPGLTESLHRFAELLRVRNVWIAGRATDRQLATAYRQATTFVSASQHEGIGIPPLEAMAFGVPVVAIGAGGVPDTIDGGGLLLPLGAGPELVAEAVARVQRDDGLRNALVHAGYRRVAVVAAQDTVGPFIEAIAGVVR